MTTRASNHHPTRNPFSDCFGLSFSALPIFCLALALALVPSWTELEASGVVIGGGSGQLVDDHATLLTNQILTVTASQLMANDRPSTTSFGISSDANATIELTGQPSAGQAVVTRKGALRYMPDAGVLGGVDRVPYRLLKNGSVVGEATLAIYLSSPIVPVAGRWQTPTCNATSCPLDDQLGYGAEIGFYHHEGNYFMVCDWVGEELRDCQKRSIVSNESVDGWRPLVADFDGDGWDELAVYDPMTGQIVVAPPSSSDSLQHGATLTASLDEPGMVVSGDWYETGSDFLALFRPTEGDFLVETSDHLLAIVGFGDATSRFEALAGDFGGGNADQLALWNYATRTLTTLEPNPSLVVAGSWRPMLADGQTPIPGIPFSLSFSQVWDPAAMGFYEPSTNQLMVTTLPASYCLVFPDDPQCGTLPLQVPVDPGGGGSTGGGGGGGSGGGNGDEPWFPTDVR